MTSSQTDALFHSIYIELRNSAVYSILQLVQLLVRALVHEQARMVHATLCREALTKLAFRHAAARIDAGQHIVLLVLAEALINHTFRLHMWPTANGATNLWYKLAESAADDCATAERLVIITIGTVAYTPIPTGGLHLLGLCRAR